MAHNSKTLIFYSVPWKYEFDYMLVEHIFIMSKWSKSKGLFWAVDSFLRLWCGPNVRYELEVPQVIDWLTTNRSSRQTFWSSMNRWQDFNLSLASRLFLHNVDGVSVTRTNVSSSQTITEGHALFCRLSRWCYLKENIFQASVLTLESQRSTFFLQIFGHGTNPTSKGLRIRLCVCIFGTSIWNK